MCAAAHARVEADIDQLRKMFAEVVSGLGLGSGLGSFFQVF